MRLVDIDKREDLCDAMCYLFSDCHFQHKTGCIAPTCRECIDRFFNYTHLLPTVTEEDVKAWLLSNNHKVIISPCKIGDTIYFICSNDTILEGTVKSIESKDYVLVYVSAKRTEYVIPKKAFGKMAFPTREEAEQALRECESEA